MFTRNQNALLAILLENPHREYFLQELGRLVGKKPGVFQRGLNSLVEQNLVLSRKQGPLRLFQIHQRHPLYNEIRSIVRKTTGIEANLRSIVENLPSVKTALIFGSYAKDRMRGDSDVDLVVIVTDPQAEDALVQAIGKMEKSFGREVNYKLYSDKEYQHRRKKKDPFLAELLSDKYILLKGAV